jgi:hypothetical protein
VPALPTNILSSLTSLPHAPQLAQAYLQPLDMAPGETPPWNPGGSEGGNAIAFQYWPETVQDSRGSEWNPKPIPGGSHPIYQWTHGGERRISFTAMFSTDTAIDHSIFEAIASIGALPGVVQDPYEMQALNPLSGIEKGTRDLDIRAAIAWLRWYTYPYYDEESGWKAIEPAKCLLVMPNMGLGYLGTDHITTVMTQCDVTYEACFEDGFPRLVEIALEFAEVVQEGARVAFHDRRLMSSSGYARNISNYLSKRRDRY